tara:strand:+ start:71 stop:532 length:462 start_codon:yes stop_codon:yes gene_type:complete
MNNEIKFESLKKDELNILVNGFKYWYQKNNNESSEKLIHTINDMYEASDTSIFKLVVDNVIHGVFFLIDSNSHIEIGGGLLKDKKKSLKLTYKVFDFVKNFSNKRGKDSMKVSIINKHYKYSILVKYYEGYGFKISKRNLNSTEMSFNLKIFQ